MPGLEHPAELPAPVRVGAGLVGRDEALALATRRWGEAIAGQGHTLLIAGEAGIGKSRMLAEIARAVGAAPRIDAAAWPHDAETAGALLLDVASGLRRAGLIAPGDALAARLRVDGDADAPRRRRVLVADATDLLSDALAEAPMLLTVDDLHWADELSLEVLQRLAARMPATSSMLVGGYRSDELFPETAAAGWRARLLQTRAAEEVRLPRLDQEATARLAAALLGRVPATDWAARLYGRSNGIPLHVEELIAAGSSDGVPETVAQAVLLRADELEPGVRRVVEAAAVIGRIVDAAVLEAVAEADAEAVDAALVALRDRHFLVVVDHDRATFDFRHALIRDAVYGWIPPGRRRTLHGLTARAGVASGMTDAELSSHLERAGSRDEAFRLAIAAARAARAADAHREAAALYARALRTAPRDLPLAEVAELHSHYGLELQLIDDNAGAAPELELAIRLLLEIDRVDDAVDLIADVMAVRHVLGEPLEQRVARAREGLRLLDARYGPGGGTAKARGGLLSALAAAYMLDRRLEESIAEAERGLALADDPLDRLDIGVTLGSVLVFAGRGAEGWAMLQNRIEEGLAAGASWEVPTARAFRMMGSTASVVVEYDRAEEWIARGMDRTRLTEIWSDHHYLRAHRAHVGWATGSADAGIDAAQALADGGSRTTEITALHVLGFVALGHDDPGGARRHLERALRLGEEMHELQRVSPALWGLAEAALAEGRPEEAVGLTADGAARSAEVADAAYLFPHLVTGVRARLASASADDAAAWLDVAAEPVRRRALPGTMPALDHAAGLIALARRHVVEARDLLEHAGAAWDRGRRFWEGTAIRLDLARVARRARRPAEEAALLDEVRRRAETADVPLFARLAAQQASNGDGDAPSAGPLTAREFEVALLITSGATNREIAARLMVSPKTVSAHVEHILAKLRVGRRAEVAAWVTQAAGTSPGLPRTGRGPR